MDDGISRTLVPPLQASDSTNSLLGVGGRVSFTPSRDQKHKRMSFDIGQKSLTNTKTKNGEGKHRSPPQQRVLSDATNASSDVSIQKPRVSRSNSIFGTRRVPVSDNNLNRSRRSSGVATPSKRDGRRGSFMPQLRRGSMSPSLTSQKGKAPIPLPSPTRVTANRRPTVGRNLSVTRELFSAQAQVTDNLDLQGLLSYADSTKPHSRVDESNLVVKRPQHPFFYELVRLCLRGVWLGYQMSALIGCFCAPGTMMALGYWLVFGSWNLESYVTVHSSFPGWLIVVVWTTSTFLVFSPKTAGFHFTYMTLTYNFAYALITAMHFAFIFSNYQNLSWDIIYNNWVTIAYYLALTGCFFVHGELFHFDGVLTFVVGLAFFMFMLPFWYLLNTLYTIANIDDFTWGTRDETVEKETETDLSTAEQEVRRREKEAEIQSVRTWKFVIVVSFFFANYLMIIGLLQQEVLPNPLLFVLSVLVMFSIPVFMLSIQWGLVAALNAFLQRVHALFYRNGTYNRSRVWFALSRDSFGKMRPWQDIPKFLSKHIDENGWKNPPVHEFRTDDMLVAVSSFFSCIPLAWCLRLVRKLSKRFREQDRDRKAARFERWNNDQPVPENWDRLVLLVCAYNEGEEEVNRTMNSIKFQLWHDLASLEGKQQADVIIVIDGDNELTRPCQQFFRAAMKRLSRDHNLVIIENGRACRADFADNVRVFLIVKKTNKRKRHTHDVVMSYLFQKEWQQGVPATVVFLDTDSSWSNLSLARLYKHLYMNRHVGGVTGSVSFRSSDAWKGLWSFALVWAQRFEFASGQIFVKAAESMCGSYVSCLPGAFCMVRTAALKHVFRSYTKNATGLLYRNCLDLGEDRYMTTLMLMRGWGVEYVRGVRAETGAVTNIPQLYGQRRRWVSSTLANQFVIFKELCRCATQTTDQRLEAEYASVDPRRFLSIVQLPTKTGRKRLLLEIDALYTSLKEEAQYTLSRTDIEPLIERNFSLTQFDKHVNEMVALETIKNQVKAGDNFFSLIMLLAEGDYEDERDDMFPPGFLREWTARTLTQINIGLDEDDIAQKIGLNAPSKSRSKSSVVHMAATVVKKLAELTSAPSATRNTTSDSMVSDDDTEPVIHSRKTYEVPENQNAEFLPHSSKPEYIFQEEETETNEARRKLWEKSHVPRTVQCPGCEKVFTKGTRYLAILRHTRSCALYIAYTKHYRQQKARLDMVSKEEIRAVKTGGFGLIRRRSSANLSVDGVSLEMRTELLMCGLAFSCGGCHPHVEKANKEMDDLADWASEIESVV